MSYADKTIACRDCGTDFVFTAGEQEFYAQKGFTNEPTRCPACRQSRKASGGGRGGYGERDSYGSRGGGWRLQQRRRLARDAHHHLRIVWQGGPSALRAAWRQAGVLLGLLPAAAPLELQQPLVSSACKDKIRRPSRIERAAV